MGYNRRVTSKTSTVPRRPYEKERLDKELKIAGEYGMYTHTQHRYNN